jgi:uncharacterized membrane protein (UPF0182 family)
LKIVILIVILAVAAFVGLNEFYINILWFREVGYLQVFLKSLTTQLTMGVPLFLVLFLILSVYYKLLTRSGGKTNLVERKDQKNDLCGEASLSAFRRRVFVFEHSDYVRSVV